MYNHEEIEKKWQNYWDKKGSFKTLNGGEKPKYYILIEFPYPSGTGLHIGHPRSYTALDSVARKRRMEGYNVLFPMGWDSFGLPAENYAIKNHIHPKEAVRINIDVFKNQLRNLGMSFDWDREVTTSDPEYYKWTQWQFLKFYEHDMAYKTKKSINWCTSCKVGLSNEDVEHGRCERCGGEVVQKEKEQWMLKMSLYADKLIEGLKDTDFVERVKTAQINWIGKSEGAEVNFGIADSSEILKVFTTRADTIYGVTFMVIAPEHPLIEKFKNQINNYDEVINYRNEANKKSEFERVELVKEKTGVELKGIKAINPVNKKQIPVYISDYVMMNYGTGAIMAVPAHDDRDYEFAKKFNIDIIPVIEQVTGQIKENEKTKKSVVVVVYDEANKKYLTLNWKEKGGRLFIGGSINENESALECAKREVLEETGYGNIEFVKETLPINHHYYAYNKGVAYSVEMTGFLFKLNSNEITEQFLDEDEKDNFELEWVSKETVIKEVSDEGHKTIFNNLIAELPVYIGDGIMVNSGILNGIDNKKDSIKRMIKYLEENNLGKLMTNYRLQDWVFSRQRFWGEPIPMIYCEHCGWVSVPEKDLPVLLPEVAEYEPTDNGESPLANMPDWYTVPCPKCGLSARRETDTMPNWAGSSWYWLRYMDAKNDQEFVGMDAMKYWGMVDWYNGGMEHATRHLLYARFWHRFLFDIGLVPTPEPFLKRTAHGMILGEDGSKISKSKGNGINPNEIVKEYGADALRTFELFIGDYETETSWSTNGLKGCRRFLDRLWRLQERVVPGDEYSKDLEPIINKTIKKVGYDLENLKFNTAVSSLMTLLNEYESKEQITKGELKLFITLLNPIAPHITEEIYEKQGFEGLLCEQKWPTYDESKTLENEFELVVQINGKIRGRTNCAIGTDVNELKEMALNIESVKTFIGDQEIKKIIPIKDKLVNIVI